MTKRRENKSKPKFCCDEVELTHSLISSRDNVEKRTTYKKFIKKVCLLLIKKKPKKKKKQREHRKEKVTRLREKENQKK